MQPTWKGIFPAVTTQFNRDESLNLEATAKHIEALIASGVHGLVMLGSLRETTTLEPEEKRKVISLAKEVARRRLPVLSGVAECSTTMACRYARDMEALGADGLMVLPAMVYKSDPRETISHFRAIARSTRLPILVYNNPIGYGVDVTPEMFAELADEKNLVAIKESSGNPRRITDLFNTVGDRYTIFCGVDDLIMEAFMLGAQGWVAGLGLAFPNENQYFWNLLIQNRWDEARAFYRWYTPLLHLDVHVKFVHYIKLAVQECGLGHEWLRSPKLPLAGQEREQILKIIHTGIKNRPKLH